MTRRRRRSKTTQRATKRGLRALLAACPVALKRDVDAVTQVVDDFHAAVVEAAEVIQRYAQRRRQEGRR